MPAAAAQTVSLTNTGYLSEQDMELRIFYGNGSYAGTLNTSDPIILDGSMDYIIFVDEKQINLIEHPETWLSWLVTKKGIAFFVVLTILGLVIMIISKAWHGGRRGSGK
jgi:hypothetical protein